MTKKRRLLFGAVDIGYRIEHYTNFITDNYGDKIEVESFSKYVLPESHYKTKYTYVCKAFEWPKFLVYTYIFFFFIRALFRYDIFHFFSGETILTRKLRRIELATYKILKKRVIMHFVGSDIRSPEYTKWKNDHIEDYLNNRLDNFPPITEPWQNKLINDSRKYANEIIVSTPDLLKIIPEANFYPVVIDYSKFKREVGKICLSTKQNGYKILHSPSNRAIKGTRYIDSIIDNQDDFKSKVEFILPHRNHDKKYYSVSRYELFELFKQSTIVIDQVAIGWYGLQSIEALLTGNFTFCYVEESLEKFLFPDCPIINANALNLKDKLASLVNGDNKIADETFNRNINWVLKYHTIENNNKILLRAWEIK